MMVSDFIDHTTASWLEEKVHKFFLPMDSGDQKYPIEHESSRGFLGVAFQEKWCFFGAISVSNAGHNEEH
jgi:hypothetical protein